LHDLAAGEVALQKLLLKVGEHRIHGLIRPRRQPVGNW
jgi:hypothetical protein